MGTYDFFTEGKQQSLVKTAIVSKYFWAWAKVMCGTMKRYNNFDRIVYIDLFAGPGRYEDGTVSTPVIILKKALSDNMLRNCLVTIFNDMDSKHYQCLEKEIKNIRGIENLKYNPSVFNEEVGENIVSMFEEINLSPTFFFVDPWGYKGLSLRLVNSVLKDWGCDCVFFFNYNRINMGITNPLVKEHMDALFGEELANNLRSILPKQKSHDREESIVNSLAEALNPDSDRYVLPFCFKDNRGKRTKHHLIFVTKDFKGYEIMKEIMAKESSDFTDGVGSFTYFPAKLKQGLLFKLSRPINELKQRISTCYAGQKKKMVDIYKEHSVGTKYIKRNYKHALLELEKESLIITSPSLSQRKRGTIADHVMITFPS